MFSDGNLVGDGSWELRVLVTEMNEGPRTLRVKGESHIGGVMLQLVEDLGISMDWSDFALWWPERNMWLSRTRFTLDQYGVQADALLYFTPVHKMLRVELPDRRLLDCKVDFSIKTFNAVVQLAKELGIRHPEELSFARPLGPEHLKQNFQQFNRNRRANVEENGRGGGGGKSPLPPDTNTFIPTANGNGSMYSRHNNSTGSSSSSGSSGYLCAPVRSPNKTTPISSPMSSGGSGVGGTPWHTNGGSASPYNTMNTMNGSYSPTPRLNGINDIDVDALATSPPPCSAEQRSKMIKPKSLIERARMNVAWLDSSLSIMEQGVREFDTLLLRFKFYSFYDLNPKYDAVRINQLYEQARWQLLNEEIECTEEEMLMFSALQLQVNLQVNVPQPEINNPNEDDIDAALNDLQITLEGSSVNSRNILHAPELSESLRVLKPKKFTLKSFKRFHVTYRDLNMSFQKSRGDLDSGFSINLRGCEVTPDVNISQGKYGIKLEVPGPEGIMTEYWIRCDSEEQYSRWMAACKLGSKGKTLADSSYDSEVKTIQTFLAMQHRAPTLAINPSSFEINPNEYVAQRFQKKIKGKLTQRILESHTNVKDCNLIEAKLNYIKAWQSLPDYGLTLFVVRFSGQKKDELLGVTFNRIMRLDLNNGVPIKAWRYNTMKSWNVNWNLKLMMVQSDEENVNFSVLSSDCKVVHEFIGGYIFLSLRNKDASQTLNEELFHRLTGGWA